MGPIGLIIILSGLQVLFYKNSIPKWVAQFHSEFPISSYMDKWDGEKFNYDLKKELKENGASSIKSTPRGNDYTLDFSSN